MEKKYLLHNNLSTQMLLIGGIVNGNFEAIITLEFTINDIILLITKSSLNKPKLLQLLKESNDIIYNCMSASSIDDIISSLKENGFTEYKLNENLLDVWKKLISLK